MTYLELVQQAAFESGTFPSLSSVTTVTGQTGRKAQFVDAVKQAWINIQASRNDWFWLRDDFTSAAILDPTSEFSASDLGVSTRFSRWLFDMRPGEDSGWSLYLTATGVSDEQPLRFMPYNQFRLQFLRGSQTANRPAWFTINPERKVVLGPAPDADYTIRGERMKSAQALSANSDEPECPADYHMAIVWDALVMMTEKDEAIVQDPAWRARRKEWRDRLAYDQAPRLTMGGPLA
jgi:hypothetical protein